MKVLSAMQPSGTLHLGNFFGSMLPNRGYQDSADQALFFIVDLHAMTTVHDADVLRKARHDAARDYLAAGFDPEKAVIFFQSAVPEHAELQWILSTLTPMGLLERSVSYKDKVQKGIDSSAGLFMYPVLMAADILLYDADKVPVGKDQKQHVEMARDIAQKFNNAYGETFALPEPEVREEVAVVPGTDGQKMSKSYGNTIPLFGDEKSIQKAIMSTLTDSKEKDDPKDPDTCVIYQIHKLLLDESAASALADEYRNGLPYGDAKKRLFETYMDYFGEMRKKHEALKDDFVAEVLYNGAIKAREIAVPKMEAVKRAVGLL
ncbi:MAG: tryptophan--tRNA ligase [bacterium]|nr:tryptophan--tRNA ligase [bacterium]MDA1292960.1 tryptophan--tRNA ligase [bacterium]